MRRALTLAALLVAGCGGTGAELPDAAGADYRRWRGEAERVCKDLRAKVEELPDPGREVRGGSDGEKLRRLAETTRPIAALYARAAQANRAIRPPGSRADVARRYVAVFAERARTYGEIPVAAARGDAKRASDLVERDEALAEQLALATETAAVRC